MSLSYDTANPVLVTGATGYVAGWLVKLLLDEGFTVHAAIRNPDDKRKRGHLDEMAESAPGTIRYFAADLLEDGSFAEAMQGCQVVFHTASPFTMKYDDPQAELVDPALQGTRNVLRTANDIPSVKRVVVTSSIAAIRGGDEDQRNAENGVLSEKDWNTQSSLDNGPYAYSKTLAEREAWSIADGQDRWRLVVVNPGLVTGPGTAPSQTSASFDIVGSLSEGGENGAAPASTLPVVDVRDVAQIHFRAGFDTEAEGRHMTFAKTMWMGEIVDHLAPDFPDFAWPSERPKSGESLPFEGDNSKVRDALGVEFRPVEPGLTEMFRYMIASGDVKVAA